MPFHMRRLHCGVLHCMPNSITSIQGRGFFRDSGFGLVLSAAAACATWRPQGTERLEHNRRCSVAGCAEFSKRIGQARLGCESSGSAFHAAAPLLNKAPEFHLHLKPPGLRSAGAALAQAMQLPRKQDLAVGWRRQPTCRYV